MLKEWKKECIIHDANWKKFWIEMEVTYRNGYPEFTICNQNGQGQDYIVPRTPAQKELLIMWHTWHLNGMHAGTEEQERALANWPNPPTTRSYEGNTQYLKDINMYEVLYKGQPYKYGNGWIKKYLPEDFIIRMKKLCETLDKEEEEYGGHSITEDYITHDCFIEKAEELDITPAKLMAICLHCDIHVETLDDIEKDYGDNRFTVEGEDYLVCTDDEADDEHLEYIKNLVDEIGWEAFGKNASLDVSRNDFGNIEVSQSIIVDESERGSSLSSWDGEEHEVTVEGETFYLYRN